MNRINVLFVTASTTGGGAERMLFNIIRSLDDNHKKRLFITSDQRVPDEYKSDIDSYNANKRHAISAFPSLLKEIKQFCPKYIFTTSSNVGYQLVLAKKLLRKNFKIIIRCAVTPSEIYQTNVKEKLLRSIIRATYNSADLIIAQTEFMRSDLIQTFRIRPEKVKTIRNIVDTEFIKYRASLDDAHELSSANYNIVAAGALYSVKGFDILIDAIAPLISGTERHLYILGEERYETGYRSLLQGKISDLGAQDNIHLLGHRNNPYPYLRKADLFVMSSRKEGYPNVVLETLTLGTPVVVTDCVDWTEVILSGENGFVVGKCDIESMKAGLSSAMSKNFDFKEFNINNYNYNGLFS